MIYTEKISKEKKSKTKQKNPIELTVDFINKFNN